MEFPTSFSAVITIFFSLSIFLVISNAIKKQRNSKKIPPGPWRLPVIGNLHQMVTKFPHHKLREMAKKYGPLMHLQLGEVKVLVVTSPRIAKEIYKTQDQAFASRPGLLAFKVIFYDREDVAFHPYDDYWRQMRKIFVMELLSAKKVKSFEPIRREEGDRLVASIRNSAGKPVNLSDKIGSFTSSVVCKAAFGRNCKDPEKFLQLIRGVSVLAGGFGIADMFPSLKFIHFLSGTLPKLVNLHNQIDDIVEDVINVHIQNSASKNRRLGGDIIGEEDFVETLLRIKETRSLNIPITIKNIKAIILDVFAAGNETSTTVTVWAMAELMKNPHVMAKAQAEIRKAFEGKETIDEVDIQSLKYLELVVKEALRLHPATPLVPPRESIEDTVIDGYHIANKTKIVVNAWAIGRDPNYWNDPDKFMPERFENNNLDFWGNDFEYLPFGAGRRICPGIAFGLINIHLPLALMLHHFDWELPKGIKPEDFDMTEVYGATCPPLNQLYLIPTPRSSSVNL